MSNPSSPKPVIPPGAEPIAVRADGKLDVPDRPIIPFIEGDGTGPDIWRASRARASTPRSRRPTAASSKIAWMEVYAGEKAFNQFEQLAARRDASRRSASTSSASRAR